MCPQSPHKFASPEAVKRGGGLYCSECVWLGGLHVTTEKRGCEAGRVEGEEAGKREKTDKERAEGEGEKERRESTSTRRAGRPLDARYEKKCRLSAVGDFVRR